jgi:hypothetical protein
LLGGGAGAPVWGQPGQLPRQALNAALEVGDGELGVDGLL